jgi:dTDP-4-amino-4,6-dideoxygalactose transaminase
MFKLENKYVNIDSSDIQSVVNVLNKKQLSGTADAVKLYEEKLSKYFNIKYAHACSSGTAGIELILRSIGVSHGDEVLLPPTGPVMCILPIIAIGATPVFVDVDSNSSFGINSKDLKRKITPKTKALLTIPMWGYPIHMKEVIRICKDNKIILIEDASHCHGGMFDDKYIGTLADISILSTQERKMITTGEGGIILTNISGLSQRVQEMRNFGRVNSDIAYFDKKIDDFGNRFGLNFRISAINAGLGISQLEKLDKKIEQRTKNANYIKKRLNELDWIEELPIIKNSRLNYYSIIYKIINASSNNYEVGKYLEENGVISDTYRYNYQPLYKMTAFKKYKSNCPNAEDLTKSIFTLPTHEGLTKNDLDLIVNLVTNYNVKHK